MKLHIGLVLILGLWSFQNTCAQPTISLNALYDAMKSFHPLHNLYELQKSIGDQQLKINQESNLPQANLSGQATWQSAVTKIPFSVPGIDIPAPPKDQYRAVLELSQSLYDGGTSKAVSKQITEQGQLEKANTDLMIYAMKENVCKAFYGALIADLAIDQLNILINDMDQRESLLTHQIKEGISSGYQASVLKVKIMEAKQSKDEILKQKQNAIQTLKTLTGMNLSIENKFNGQSTLIEESRPEYKIYDSQRKLSMVNYEVNKTRYNPRIQAIAQLGFGSPGLNLLSNDFKGYSILGFRAAWNLSNLYLHHTNKENEILQNNLNKIQVQRDAFDVQLKIKADLQKNDILNYQSQLRQDEEIINLFESILKSSAIRLEQGIATITEYTADANNLTQAKIKKSLHETLLLQATELLNLTQSK